MKGMWAAVALWLSASLAFAQNPDFTLWSRTYGGAGAENGYAMQPTADGGFVIAGNTLTYGAGGSDFWLVKTDPDGNMVWSRTYGESADEICNAMQITADGGYILAGQSYSYGGIWLVKTNSNGDSLWSRVFTHTDSRRCYALQQTTDGGYILAGDIYQGTYKRWTLKTNANGDSLWGLVYNAPGTEYAYAIEQTTDGGYILGGATNSGGHGGFDMYLAKLDANGYPEWGRAFGTDGDEFCYSVQQTSDGGYVLGGGYRPAGTASDLWVIKTDANGYNVWNRHLGGAGTDQCRVVREDAGGGYYAAGYTASYSVDGSADGWLVRLSATGDSIWSRTYGGNGTDIFRAMAFTDCGVVPAGYTASSGGGSTDFWLVLSAFSNPLPRLAQISDVGNDQGRRARLRWQRSNFDGVCPGPTLTGYSIYRRIDQYRSTDMPRRQRGTLDWPPGEWEYISTVPARGEAQYATVVPTLADSNAQGVYWSVFFVSAETDDPLEFYDSTPDSGYSIDNLAPDATVTTAMVPGPGGQLRLQWEAVTTGGGGQPEHGDIWYKVYGSINPNFVPGPATLLVTTRELYFVPDISANQRCFFIVRASETP